MGGWQRGFVPERSNCSRAKKKRMDHDEYLIGRSEGMEADPVRKLRVMSIAKTIITKMSATSRNVPTLTENVSMLTERLSMLTENVHRVPGKLWGRQTR